MVWTTWSIWIWVTPPFHVYHQTPLQASKISALYNWHPIDLSPWMLTSLGQVTQIRSVFLWATTPCSVTPDSAGFRKQKRKVGCVLPDLGILEGLSVQTTPMMPGKTLTLGANWINSEIAWLWASCLFHSSAQHYFSLFHFECKTAFVFFFVSIKNQKNMCLETLFHLKNDLWHIKDKITSSHSWCLMLEHLWFVKPRHVYWWQITCQMAPNGQAVRQTDRQTDTPHTCDTQHTMKKQNHHWDRWGLYCHADHLRLWTQWWRSAPVWLLKVRLQWSHFHPCSIGYINYLSSTWSQLHGHVYGSGVSSWRCVC